MSRRTSRRPKRGCGRCCGRSTMPARARTRVRVRAGIVDRPQQRPQPLFGRRDVRRDIAGEGLQFKLALLALLGVHLVELEPDYVEAELIRHALTPASGCRRRAINASLASAA